MAGAFQTGGQWPVPDNLDYYAILQVNRNATLDEIERAHERLSRTYDPGTSRKPRAAQRHAEVQEAFEVLSNREKRREYDSELRRGEREVAGTALPSDVLSNRFVLAAAGTLITGIVAVLIIIILLGGSGGEKLVVDPTAAVTTPTPTPTVPGQTPGVAPESPPEIAGEQITTESGLVYIDFEPGTGEIARIGDTVAVNYTGWLQDTGVMFDSSVSRTSAFQVVIGAGDVIQGWDEGLQGIAEGGKRRLIIPPGLAYGETGQGSIPPNATLIFDIELVDILVPAPAPTALPTPTPPAQTPGVPDESPPDVSGAEITLDSGLVYIDFAPGTTGEIAETGDTVAVNYTGWLQDTGEMFDSSVSRDSTYPVTIGAGGVIPGWEQGLIGLAEGGSRRLIIPPALAYGETGQGSIPPNATLIFDIVLVDILAKAPVPTETPAQTPGASP
jgi:peptidylprolyl isomerase